MTADDELRQLRAENAQLKAIVDRDNDLRFETRRAFDRELRLLREANSAIRDAVMPIINPLLLIGEQTAWRDGDETDRVYSWAEFKPLLAAMVDQPDETGWPNLLEKASRFLNSDYDPRLDPAKTPILWRTYWRIVLWWRGQL